MYANTYRGIMDARRMLRKCAARKAQFLQACEIADESDKFTGPMRGTTMHAKTLGMQITYRDEHIYLVTPFGSNIDICTDQETHLRSCLREAARHASLTALQQRIEVTALPHTGTKKRIEKTCKELHHMSTYKPHS